MSDKSPKVIPPFVGQPANSGGRVGDTDWMCPDVVCGNVNFARRNSCNRCGKERVDLKSKKKLGTEIGKSAADKSRGLFSADDWQCNKCANVNWARRQTCNVCNAPKFGEQVEARTGYGGGYNERGTVEYRPKRDSDDDEYDEFGRRKKRKLKDCSSTQDKVMVPVTLRPRTLIMENRVSSTNELKYRFSGKTRDENFEVTYTLQEQVSAAAWALAYQNCRLSSEKFQNTFDKPAPDFKTIFAWRQRLLYNGCLVDKHFYIEDDLHDRKLQTKERSNKLEEDLININVSSHNTTNVLPGRFNRRKRLRYFKNIPPRDTTDSSTSESEDLPRKSTRRSLPMFKKVIVLSEEKQKVKPSPIEQVILSDASPEEHVERFVGTTKAQYMDANRHDNCKNLEDNHDEYTTEDHNIQSVTPELTTVRSDLANFRKSPVRVEIPESQFSEDIYFHDDIPLAAKINKDDKKDATHEVEQFLMPDIPKEKKLLPKPIDPLLNVLEDIVSESDRYSSDGNASETDSYEKMYGKEETIKKSNPPVPEPYSVPKEIPKYQPSHTAASDFKSLPLLKFAHKEKVKIFNDETFSNSSNTQRCTKNMSVAMRRIYESMTSSGNTAERIDELVLEYIPTKINPAMAKRNHQFFNDDPADDVILECNAQPLQISKMPSPIKATIASPIKPDIFDIVKKKVDSPKKPVFKLPMFENYLPEEDDLYKDSSSDGGASDRTMLRTPPAAPNIGPMVTEIVQEPQKVQDHMTENMTIITKVMCQPMAAESPSIVAQVPVFVGNHPVVFDEPPPPVVVNKPTVILNTSPVAATKSTAPLTKPSVSPTKPMCAVTKPPVPVTKNTVELTKSRVASIEPVFAVTKPPNAVTKPTAAVNSPLVTFIEPPVTVSKPSDTYNKSPGAYTKSPDTYNKSPGAYTKSPDTYNKSPGVYSTLPDTYNNKLPDTYNKSPDTYNKSPDTYNKSPGAYTKSPDTYNKSPNTYNKSPGVCNKSPETCNKSPDAYNKSSDVSNKLPGASDKSPDVHNKPVVINNPPDVCNQPVVINSPPAIFAMPPIDFSKPPPQIAQKELPNLPSSICNFNFANINANDIIRALQNIQNLSTASAEIIPDVVGDKQNVPLEEGDLQIVEDRQQEVIDCDVEEVVKKPASIPFLSDMFDPGSPVHQDTSPKDPEVTPDFNFEVPSDNYLDLPLAKPIVGSFKSFAFAPKPIMLNRLKKINEQKLGKSRSDEANQDDRNSAKNKKRPRPDNEDDEPSEEPRAGEDRARPDEVEDPEVLAPAAEAPEEEDEESGEEGDLSKYDLWGSEDEGGEKDQSKSPPAAANNNPVEKVVDSPKNKSKSPPSKNSADKRKRKSESCSPSSRSSSSSSSSSDSSSGRAPRNRYDDFDLNSEHSPPSPPGRKDRGRGDRTADRNDSKLSRRAHRTPRHSSGIIAHSTTSANNNRSSSSHKVDSGRRHRAHRHRR